MITEQERQKAEQLIAQARHAALQGDRVQARRLAMLAARLDPVSDQPWLLMASLAAPRASIAYYQKALAANPKSEAARRGLRRSAADPAGPAQVTLPAKRGRVLPWVRREQQAGAEDRPPGTLQRVVQYSLARALTLFLTLVASLFLIIYIVNLGGYLDTILRGAISESVALMGVDAAKAKVPPDEIPKMLEQARASMEAAYGLDQPFLLRCAGWLYRGITFNWGETRSYYYIATRFDSLPISNNIRQVIQAYLPRTLLLLGTSNFGIFLISVLLALLLTRRPGSWTDRLIMALAPSSAAPAWVYGLILYAFSYKILGVYNLQLGFSEWRPALNLDSIVLMLRGLALPFLAIFISKFFQSVYAWRTYFLVYAREDYIELARAKGLPDSVVERRYLLRPALPGILTAFALIVIGIWQECIALEYFFKIQGIGGLFVLALNTNDIAMIVALAATFAYFLAITMFLLEIIYALIDPRVKLEKERLSGAPQRADGRLRRWLRGESSAPGRVSPDQARAKAPVFQRVPRIVKKPGPGFRQQASRAAARWARWLADFRSAWRSLARSPMALSGAGIILALALLSAYTVITIPYHAAIRQWRGTNDAWRKNPVEAPPRWINLFLRDKLPETILVNSQSAGKVVSSDAKGTRTAEINLAFDYPYNSLPQDLMVQFAPRFKERKPFASLTWVRPDGQEIPIKGFSVTSDMNFYPGKDSAVLQKLSGRPLLDALFLDAGGNHVVPGRYALRVSGFLFEEGSDLDAELVVFGKVFGWAGTDPYRRDLSLVLLWGTVIALSFGVLAAIGTTVCSVILAGLGAWFGGWLDGLIQRITEINMVLPVLPVSILVFYLYSKSFWVLLGVVICLNIFGNGLKTYRAMFLQFISAPYIDAARAYGAPSWRIITRYLIPRIRAVFIPQFITLIPGYIFLEATLAFLGVSDPALPTLGKLVVTTLKAGVFSHPLYLTLEPFALLVCIGMGFALLGFALERVYNEQAGA